MTNAMKKNIGIIIILVLLTACNSRQASNDMPKKIREPFVAGAFYKASPDGLKADIYNYLASANIGEISLKGEIKALVVPHAGYDFSAPVAAYAYKAIEGKSYGTVVLISNSHSAYFQGIAVDDSDIWRTPLGEVEVDRKAAEKLKDYDKSITINGEPHTGDHVLEVQVPFLQSVLKKGFKILPILFGNTDASSFKKLAQALLDTLDENSLVIISSDMSHYPSYENANNIDNKTIGFIEAMDIYGLHKHIDETQNSVPNEQTLLCGIDGVKTVMEMASSSDWKAARLRYANSGDVSSGDRSKVVGYGAMVFAQAQGEKLKVDDSGSDSLNSEQKNVLLTVAKEAVEGYVKNKKIPEYEINDERLNRKEGAFVTLKINGQLKGCIGRFSPADIPLWQVVREMAIAAATEDNRFVPVSVEELNILEYEISVLSIPKKIDNWQDIKLGRDGVVVRKGGRSGVFLPQVAIETGWTLEEFLENLCYSKAGLPPDCYKNDNQTEIFIFTAQVFEDRED
jgi:MEMO1 family protein